jgi:WD40 repeat protein
VGHQGDVDTVAWHPNGNLLLSASGVDRSARLWDLRSASCVRLLQGHMHGVSAVAVSPDGTTVATGTRSGALHVWDLASAQLLSELAAHRRSIESVAFSRGGQLLASGGADCTVALWRPCGCVSCSPHVPASRLTRLGQEMLV